MNKLYKPWKKQLDDFDTALDGLRPLERGVRAWGSMAPAVPVLYDTLMEYIARYKATSDQQRMWMEAHDEDGGDPNEFSRYLHATIEASRRVKGLIDAYNREKVAAEALYPEMAAGHSLKDTGVVPFSALPGDAADADTSPKHVDPTTVISNATKAQQQPAPAPQQPQQAQPAAANGRPAAPANVAPQAPPTR